MNRKVIAVLEVDDDKAFEEIDDGPIPYIEREAGWLEQSGIALKDAFIADDDECDDWQAYLNYLCEWVFGHQGFEDKGMTPASFDEWLDNERQGSKENEEDFPLLSDCKDFAVLCRHLKYKTLKFIEAILEAPLELVVPRTADDYPDFDAEWTVVVNSTDYEFTGFEATVLRWYESFEDTADLIADLEAIDNE